MTEGRRKFLKSTSGAIAGSLLLPWYFTSCKKSLNEAGYFKGKVIVVGAGISGLYSAWLLKQQGADVTLLEASDRIGGRIKSIHDFASFPVELGADIIRGERSVFYDLIRNASPQFIEDELLSFYYFNGSLKNEVQASGNTFFNIISGLRSSLSEYTGNDISASDYAGTMGVSLNVEHIYNAWLGNQNGTDAGRIGVYGLRTNAQRWSAGNKQFHLKNADLISILNSELESVMSSVQLEKVVEQIDYSSSQVIVTCADDSQFTADKIILTVPIPVLKSSAITFSPSLPQAKINALNSIRMDDGLIVVVKFSEAIWPSGTLSVFGEGMIPEFRVVSTGRSTTEFILKAIINGSAAELLSASSDAFIIQTVLSELDTVFGNASSKYVSHHIQNWGAEQHIGGVISYLIPGAGTAREQLALSVNDKVYFAGEATHTRGHASTIHGAMETGLRAVLEINDSKA